MSKKLVVYFSASGVTKNAAEKLAKAAGADIFEIRPAVPYTRADLNWMDKHSRSSKEMNDAASRPEIAALPQDMSGYDTVFIGFPIWRYGSPSCPLSCLCSGPGSLHRHRTLTLPCREARGQRLQIRGTCRHARRRR